MTDNPTWHSPSSPADDSTGGKSSPAGAPPVPPPSTTGGWQTAGHPLPQRPGWTPPPRPGLIPLRPLDLGTLLGAAFRTMRHNPKATFGTALLVQGGVYVLAIAVVGIVSFLSFSRLDSASVEDRADIQAGSYAAIAISAVVPLLLAVAASALLQGVIVLDVMRATLGEKPTLRQLLRMARGRIWALIGWTVMLSVAILIAVGLVVGLIVLLVVTGGALGVAFAVLLGIFGGLGLIVLWAWLSTKLVLVPSVLMAERLSIRAAMVRSWRLTKRSFWKIFGIQLLVSAIVGIATQVVTTPISFIAGMLFSLADPNGQSVGTAIGGAIAVYVLLVVVSVVFGAIGTVVQSATVALLYLDQRMRKEGLDLELSRFVEARSAGQTELADPYALKVGVAADPARVDLSRYPAPHASAAPPTDQSPWI